MSTRKTQGMKYVFAMQLEPINLELVCGGYKDMKIMARSKYLQKLYKPS